MFDRLSHFKRSTLMLALVAMLATLVPAATAPPAQAQQLTVDQINDELGLGVNLGNALEGPREGDWGLTLRSDFFPTIAAKGFGHVRVPIRFSAYTGSAPEYTIPDGVDPSVPNADNLWERIDWVIANAQANGLYVIIDVHLYRELSVDVAGERDRFLAIWEQIATRYADAGRWVLFELLNEPQGQFNEDPELLNTLIADALAVIRPTNPTRPVLVGPAQWNSIHSLDSLELPADPNLIVSVHFYDPFDFTHQGASWIEPVPPPAPAEFEADLVHYGAGWQDWSWGTTTVASPAGLRVIFARQWAGVAFGHPDLFDPATVTVRISGDAELSVRCADVDETNYEIERIVTTDTPTTFVVDLTSCLDETRAVNLMVRSPEFDQLLFADGELCEASGRCTRLIETGQLAIESAFEAAHAWGLANNRPMHVGEFGAYSAEGLAPLSERVEWTEIVREAGRSRGFSMSYWEFGAGFGVYDTTTNTWLEPLVDALGVEPSPGCGPEGFVDVAGSEYYTNAVQWAACAGVTTGTSNTTFSPAGLVTRAQLATFLWRYAGEPTGFSHPFVDVASPSHYEDAVAWMAATGITTGTTTTTFSPNDLVTRAQLATFLWRYAGEPTGFSHPFVDVASPSYYEDAVAWMAASGITTGTTTTTFSPEDSLTRGQAVTFLWRYAGEPVAAG